MTREEAIHELQEDKRLYETDLCHAGDGSPDGRLLEALDMAIEALQVLTDGDIIRCMDCYWYDKVKNDCDSCGWCKRHRFDSYDEGFCSWATLKKQITGKLKKPCDSLLKSDPDECKEQKNKLDLISRADAIEAVQKEDCCGWIECKADNIYNELNHLPSVDTASREECNCVFSKPKIKLSKKAVEFNFSNIEVVVRCKDCIYSDTTGVYVEDVVHCKWLHTSCVKNGYCHRGKRKGGDAK